MILRKFLIIANPASGSRRGDALAEKVQTALGNQGIGSVLVHTSLTTPLIEQLSTVDSSQVTDLLVVGGDGTLNAAINATQGQWLLSIIPAGTGNDFVKNLSIGKNFGDYLHTAINGDVKKIDLGLCNGRLFLNGVGIGFDGQVVEDMLFRKSLFKGHLAYYSHVLRILSGYRERPVTVYGDGFQIDEDLLLVTVANGTTFGGGFRLTPKALLDDGLLDVCVIRKMHPLKRFANIHRLNKGSHGALRSVTEHRTSKIRIEGPTDLAAHIDGDYLGKPPFEISLQHGACKIRVQRQ